MSSGSEHSAYSIPVFSHDEFRKIEEASNKALKNIQTLYCEIMTPKTYTDFDCELSDIDDSTQSTPVSLVRKNRPVSSITNLKSKPRTELCNSCQKYISYCSTCHNCDIKNFNRRREPCVRNNSIIPDDKYKNHVSRRSNETNKSFNITIPQPFSLTVENVKRQEAKAIKVTKLKEQLDKEIERELNVKVCSKPVPKHVRLPLYEEMVKKNEKRKQDRKEKCLEILEKETKPFNLSASSKKDISRSKSVCDLRNDDKQSFKAKPVPKNILSENISKRIQDKEELRKILIAHRAEEMLKQSSLPFSPKHIPRSYSMLNLNTGKNNSVKLPKPNIDAITKRLYTIKCRETIENWNNRVLESNKCENKLSDSVQNSHTKLNKNSTKSTLLPDYTLPFYNYPVRMSNAAALREKQIRAELSLRKRREEEDAIIKEEISRKKKDFHENIWPRLKSVDPTIDSDKEIEEKVKSFRASQKNREQEYKIELEEMMKRVSKQYLLIERQSKRKEEVLQEVVTRSEEKTSDKESSIDAETENSEEIDESPTNSEKSDT